MAQCTHGITKKEKIAFQHFQVSHQNFMIWADQTILKYSAGHDKVNSYIQNQSMSAGFSDILKFLSQMKILSLLF